MTIEQRVREALHDKVAQPPAVQGLADRSLRRAARTRRRRGAAAVACAVGLAVAVPVALRPETKKHPAPPVVSTSLRPTTSPTSPPTALPSPFSVLQFGGRPQVHMLIGEKLIAPTDDASTVLPPGRTKQLVASGDWRAMLNEDSRRVFAADPEGNVKQVVDRTTEPITGLAIKGTRLAYGVQVSTGDEVATDLFLIDLATGDVIRKLAGAPDSTVVAFSGDDVLLTVRDGADVSMGMWDVGGNAYRAWRGSTGSVALDAHGGAALVAHGDASCVAVVGQAPSRGRFLNCASSAIGTRDRFGSFSPDGRRYAGMRETDEEEPRRWPVVADATTGEVDDRFRAVFERAGLRVRGGVDVRSQIAWTDETHLVVVGETHVRQKILLTCDVEAASCVIALDTGTPAAPVILLAGR